jgi:exopolysaccharide biosynthesis polyprenyl glycosylphosphotransferase
MDRGFDMHQVRRTILVRTFELFDIGALAVSALVARACVDPTFGPLPQALFGLLDQAVSMRIAVLVGALIFAWHHLLSGQQLYSSRRLSTFGAEVRDVAISVVYATGALGILTWVGPRPGLRPAFVASFLAVFLVVSLSTLVASRAILRLALRHLRLHGRNLRHVIVVGTNPRAQEYAAELRARPGLGFLVKGFVDEAAASVRLPESAGRIISTFEDFPNYLRDHVVDEVVVFAPVKSFYTQISLLVNSCEEQGVVVRLRSDLFQPALGDLEVEESPAMAFPLVTVYTGRMRGWKMLVKRLMDILGASILLVLASPVMFAAGIAVRLSAGPGVLFVQERLGLNKRRFRLLKFRTMVRDAEVLQKQLEEQNEVDGAAFKIRDDPRITGVGRFLRKTSVDELPQLLNVLRGDMSLVGPRPLPVRDYERFSDHAHRRRFSVRPGLTCLWQVSGRNGIPFDRWMQLDMEYIDKWSLGLDVVILAKTVPAVLRATGT